jgi:protein-tyrosine phosphatase
LGTFSIVFICTGNRFRSVLAEAFVQRLTVGLPVTTESFGTLELNSAPALPEAVELGRSYGIDVSRHATRCVTGTSLAETDLVLGFDGSHVREAVVKAQAARDRSFTMRELVRLLDDANRTDDGDVVARARHAIEMAAAHRGEQPSRLADDMGDPLGSPRKVFSSTAAEICELSIRLVAALFGVTNTAGLLAAPSAPARRARMWRR